MAKRRKSSTVFTKLSQKLTFSSICHQNLSLFTNLSSEAKFIYQIVTEANFFTILSLGANFFLPNWSIGQSWFDLLIHFPASICCCVKGRSFHFDVDGTCQLQDLEEKWNTRDLSLIRWELAHLSYTPGISLHPWFYSFVTLPF